MKHLRPFNEKLNFDDSDLNQVNDLLIDLKEYFDIRVDSDESYLSVYGKLTSKDYSIKDVSIAFDELINRLKLIYQNAMAFKLICENNEANIHITIHNYLPGQW